MKKSADTTLTISADYRQFIEELKARVVSGRISAARRINHEMIFLYWDIGRGIVEKQQALGWGESVVEMVAADLQRAFPSMSGFSPRNVWDMRRLYEAYSAPEFLALAVRETGQREANSILRQAVAESGEGKIWSQVVAAMGGDDDPGQFLRQLVAEIPWGQNLLILRSLVAFDLKVGPFEPEYAGKMDFYLNLLNDTERGPEDQPSIGIILCAEKDDVEVEYALRSKANPIGVAVYELQSKLPGELKGKLPTAKQLADVVRVEMEEGE